MTPRRRRRFSFSRTSPDLRRDAAPRGADLPSRRATGSASSAATARASRRCSRSPPGWSARQRRAVLPAVGDRALPAAGAGPLRLRDDAGLCRGRARPGRRPVPRALSAGAARPHRRRGARAPVRRRGAARRARPRAGARARHPAARRADQPPRPAGHRMAGGELEGAALGARAHQPRPPLPRDACRARRSGSTAARRAGSTRASPHFEAWRDKVLEEEERERHKLDRQIVAEEHWLRYGVTARRKRNMRRLGELPRCASDAARAHRAPRHGELDASPRPSRPASW